MSAKHALLGLLLHRDAYTYQLGERLQERLGPAWAINSGHLYQTVERLEEKGLIEHVDGAIEGRADRRVYAITASGVAEFEQWFDDAAKNSAQLPRRPLLIKVTLAGSERLRDALAQIDAYALDCAERLKEHSRAREEIPVEGPQVRADHVLQRLNLSADIFQLEAELRWARHAHEIVSWLLTQEAIWPSASERSGAATEEARRGARAELFDRMATRHMRSVREQSDAATPEKLASERRTPSTSSDAEPDAESGDSPR